MTKPDPKATKTATTFRMDCAVSISIQAAPERIWAPYIAREADYEVLTPSA